MSKETPYKFSIEERIAAIRKLARKSEDGLKLFRLIGPELNPKFNDQVGVAKCYSREQMISATNRAGKSLCAAAKMAAIIRNEPLIAWNGELINCRPPHHREQSLKVWIIGNQLNHIGQTIFRLLFEPGAFRIIPDPDTGLWRTWKPWEAWDSDKFDMTVEAPPLIPPSCIDDSSWVWESRGAHQFASVRVGTTTVHAYPSTGDVKKGDPVHAIWIDETVKYSEHYAEWISRLTDYNGILFWSTMVYPNVPAIGRVIERAEVQQEELARGDRNPEKVFTNVFYFNQPGNPYMPKESTDINREIFESEGDDVVAQRIDGGNIYDSTLIYPFYRKDIHAAIPDDKEEWDDLATVLDAHGGLPPMDWTHELAIDPGAQKPAVLFFATPPKVWKDKSGKEWHLWAGDVPYFVPYDEIYGRRYVLADLVKLIKLKMRDIRFRRFIMDMQGGRISSMTGGPPAHRQFSKAFLDAGIESEETGGTFLAGGTDFQDRRRIVESWMHLQLCGKPQLRIVTQRCPNLCSQLQRNQFKVEGEVVTDKEARRERNDLRVNLEYVASRNPKYVVIDQNPPVPTWYKSALVWEEKMFGNKDKGEKRCHFGPGIAP